MIFIVKDFKRTLKIVELERKIQENNKMKQMITKPRVGIGRPESFIEEQNKQLKGDFSKLLEELVILTQNRWEYQKGEILEIKWIKEILQNKTT